MTDIESIFQSPDLSFSQFVSVIADSKYNLGLTLLSRFEKNVRDVVNSDVDVLLNFITDAGRYLIDPGMYNTISIHRCCPVGKREFDEISLASFRGRGLSFKRTRLLWFFYFRRIFSENDRFPG